jgi:2-dehydropantoate 2-reductase
VSAGPVPHAPRSAPVGAAETTALPSVLVIGSGAVGSFLGGMLAAAGHEVVLLDRRVLGGDDATRLRIEAPDGSLVVPVHRVVDAADAGDPGCIVLAVKIFHLDGALETAARWPDAALLTVQNGVGAEALARAARRGPVLAGSLTTAVEPLADGVKRMRTGGMGVAVVPGDGADAGDPVADLLAASWSRAGLPSRVYPDAAAMKWSKLLGNLVGNATSAILDMDPGDIYADPRTYPVERRQLHEAVAVMKSLGLRPVSLPGADVSLLLRGLALPVAIGRPIVSRAIAGARGGKSPSLRLHVRIQDAGLPTEARWLNGAVADAGARTGTPAPVNACLAALVDECAADAGRAAWFAGRPDRLVEAIAARQPSP